MGLLHRKIPEGNNTSYNNLWFYQKIYQSIQNHQQSLKDLYFSTTVRIPSIHGKRHSYGDNLNQEKWSVVNSGDLM